MNHDELKDAQARLNAAADQLHSAGHDALVRTRCDRCGAPMVEHDIRNVTGDNPGTLISCPSLTEETHHHFIPAKPYRIV